MPETGNNANRPTITFTIEPAEAFRGERVTLRWQVRSADVATPWRDPVRISSRHLELPARLRESAGSSGEYSFTAAANRAQDEFTLSTGGALYAAQKTVEYRLIQEPVITRVEVHDASRREYRASNHAFEGDSVAIEGSHFGESRGDGQVVLVQQSRQGDRSLTMPVQAWHDTRIVMRVPQNASVKTGYLLVSKGGARTRLDGTDLRDESRLGDRRFVSGTGDNTGAGGTRVGSEHGRLVSNRMDLDVWGKFDLTNDDIRSFADETLHIAGTKLRIHHGTDGSLLDFSGATNDLGAPDQRFTIPNWTYDFSVPGIFHRFRFKVNDLNSRTDAGNTPEVAIVNGQLVVGFLFESSGDEILGEYVGAAPDVLVPNVQLDHVRVNLRFTPGLPSDGKLNFDSVGVRFDADVQVGADWLNSVKDLSKFEKKVRDMVQGRIETVANGAGVKRAVTDGLMQYLSLTRGVNKVRAVFPSGDHITIHYQ